MQIRPVDGIDLLDARVSWIGWVLTKLVVRLVSVRVLVFVTLFVTKNSRTEFHFQSRVFSGGFGQLKRGSFRDRNG